MLSKKTRLAAIHIYVCVCEKVNVPVKVRLRVCWRNVLVCWNEEESDGKR